MGHVAVCPEGLSSLILDHKGEWHHQRVLMKKNALFFYYFFLFISMGLLSTCLHCLHLQQHSNKWGNGISGGITEWLQATWTILELINYPTVIPKVQLMESLCFKRVSVSEPLSRAGMLPCSPGQPSHRKRVALHSSYDGVELMRWDKVAS